MSERETDNQPVKTADNRKVLASLCVVAVAMLGLGFASKPLYDTFCKITGYGGTTRQADFNDSEVLDRVITVSFDSNVSAGLPWTFKPQVNSVDVNVGQSTLAFYEATNTTNRTITGTASYNVTPIKAAPYFIKTECFCFTEQTIEPGQTVSFPVLFHVDSLIDEERRLDDITNITLSYTFFETEPTVQTAAQSREALN